MTDVDLCRGGHPWDEANTYVAPSGRRECRACRRDRRGTGFLPAGPLIAFQRDHHDALFAEIIGVSRRQVLRWRAGRSRIPRRSAERYAARLGLDASSVWPELGG